MAKTLVQGLIDGVPTRFLLVDNLEWFRCNSRSLKVGDAVYIRPDGKVYKASAMAPDQMCIGFVIDMDASDTRCTIIVNGLAEGLLQDLTPNTAYYLSLEAGRVTSAPPTGIGQRIQLLGHAVSSTDLLVSPDYRTVVNHSGIPDTPKMMVWNPLTKLYELHELPK